MARKKETDLSRYDLTRGTRGKYLEKARRSFETLIIDKKVAAARGGPEGMTAVPEALARSVTHAKKRGARRSTHSAFHRHPTATSASKGTQTSATPRSCWSGNSSCAPAQQRAVYRPPRAHSAPLYFRATASRRRPTVAGTRSVTPVARRDGRRRRRAYAGDACWCQEP
jgi:hypothetical protein